MALETKYDHALTTVDNPHNPFSHWLEWYQFDEQAGYHSLSLLDRIVTSSHALSLPDQELAILLAIQEIVELNVSGMHTMISQVQSED